MAVDHVSEIAGARAVFTGNAVSLGHVRLTLFQNKNTWSDDENGMFGAFRSSKDDKNMFKIAF